MLIGKNKGMDSLVQAAITILNQANIHALHLRGLLLEKGSKATLTDWLSVYDGKRWVFINPINGSRERPKKLLIWQYGDAPLYQLSGGKKPAFKLTVTPTNVSALSVAKMRGTKTESRLLQFSLLQLPLNVQQTYKILLTVPIGAFIILLLRNFVGLVTFGTFMPVLIALAFRETHVVMGTILFSTIVSFGLLIRFYLDGLKLLVVPRLTVILAVVIFLMIFISILSSQLGIQSGLSVALFPMVILTMVIERMCITWDERGALEAIKAGLGSLVAAVTCYFFMNNERLQYLLFAFPELLLTLMGLTLWFGQYRGYRLTELFRFEALGR